MTDLGSVLFGTRTRQKPTGPRQTPVRAGKGDRLRDEPDSLADFLFQPQEQEATFGEGFLRGLSETLVNNVINAPVAPGRLVGAAIEGIGSLTGNDLSELAKRFQTTPVIPVMAPGIPPELLPTATDVFAAGDTAATALQAGVRGQPLDLAERFRAAQVAQGFQSDQVRQQAPTGSFLGDLAGDAITIAGARVPAAVGLGQRAPLAAKAAQVAQSQARVTLPRIAKNVATSAPVKGFLRALGYSGEAALEGAFLASLKSDDPIDIAAVAAGSGLGQLGGSAALPLLPSSKKGFAGLALAAIGLTTAFRLGQEYSPGQNNIFTALDQSFEKLAIGIMAGVTAHVAGAGRARTRNASAVVSILSDGLRSLPRGAVISLWDEFLREQEAGRTILESGLAAIASDPGGFTQKQQSQIQRALKDPKMSLAETFEKLGIGTRE